MKYIAFLRGINVSGQKIIKMTDLAEIFTGFGFKNVRTYIQSGNVIFETSSQDLNSITKKIEKGLLKILGYEVKIFLRSFEEIEKLAKKNPFAKIKRNAEVKIYVSFLGGEIPENIKIPVFSKNKDVEIFKVENGNAYCLSYEMKNGNRGFPNIFIEKELKIPATTRNWNTVTKIVN